MPPNNNTARYDAADQYFLTQQLQAFDPQTRYQLVPGIVGRKIIPRISNASANLPSYKYTMTKVSGRTQRSGPKGRNNPTVNVTKEEVVNSIKTFEHTASWTIDDVRAAREVGADLDMDTMVAAMTSIEQDFDAALASGVAGTNITGLMNNTQIVATAAIDKGGGVTSWLDATGVVSADEIIADVRKLIQDAQTALKQAQVPGTDMRMFDQFALFLPLAHFSFIDMTPRSATTDTTILEFIRKFSALKAVVPWWRLDTAGAASAPKACLAPALDNGIMNPLAGGALLPLDFERLPEQPTGRNVVVPCAGKCGGVVIPYPVGFRYLTGL